VHEVKLQLVLGNSAIEANRHIDKAEADRASPKSARHERLLAARGDSKTLAHVCSRAICRADLDGWLTIFQPPDAAELALFDSPPDSN
jgi:hypothetical protein